MRNVGQSPSISYVMDGLSPNDSFDSFTINTGRQFGVGATRRF